MCTTGGFIVNEAYLKRLNLAQELAPVYAANPKVSCVLIAGSVSRGWADQHSDIEIHVLWAEAPTDEDRLSSIRQVSGEVVRFLPYEDNEWSEVYHTQGIKIEMSNFLLSTAQDYIRDVAEHFDTDWDKQILIASLLQAKPLHGAEVLARLQSAAADYPDGLAEAMIEQHFDFEDAWYYAPLAERDDVIMLHDVMTRVVSRVLSVLCALNRMYISHPRFKWSASLVAEMKFKPDNLLERLTHAYRADCVTGLRELQRVADEVSQLVKDHMPHLAK
jgi:predicted nucleotidyltransferase